jgi:hypothetical protein
VDERDFHLAYREAEQDFREQAMKFSEWERDLRREVRSMVDATPEERQARYVEGFERIHNDYVRFTKEAIVKPYLAKRGSCEQALYGPGGGRYADHLVSLASAPDERLGELASLADQAGDKDLARAVAHVARQPEARPRGSSASGPSRARSGPRRSTT